MIPQGSFMVFKFSATSIPFFVGFALALTVVIITRRWRTQLSTRAFCLMMAAVAWWALAAGMEMNTANIEGKITWSKLYYLGNNSTPVLMLLFVLHFTRRDAWLNRRAIALLWVIPIASMLLALTNEWHHLIWTDTPLDPVTGNYLWNHGVGFYIMVAYLYSLVAICIFLMARAATKMETPFRAQALTILVAFTVPAATSISYVLGFTPLAGVDLTPCFFALSGAVLTWGILRMQMLDVLPVAHDMVIESMTDGVIVLDARGRIVDINPAVRRLIGAHPDLRIGVSATKPLGAWIRSEEPTEIHLEATHNYIEVIPAPLKDHRGNPVGRVVMLRDITDRKKAELALGQLNLRLQERISQINLLQEQLREQAIRDSLTGLYNRRFLDESLSRELARAQRESYPVALVMIDIDGFKCFNDTYGHEAGDKILQALAGHLNVSCRGGDIVCRFGGDEFSLVLPGLLPRIAQRRANEWRAAFENVRIDFNQLQLFTTFSAGIAVFPIHGKNAAELIRAADHALYSAKAAGRNCVRVKG